MEPFVVKTGLPVVGAARSPARTPSVQDPRGLLHRQGAIPPALPALTAELPPLATLVDTTHLALAGGAAAALSAAILSNSGADRHGHIRTQSWHGPGSSTSPASMKMYLEGFVQNNNVASRAHAAAAVVGVVGGAAAAPVAAAPPLPVATTVYGGQPIQPIVYKTRSGSSASASSAAASPPGDWASPPQGSFSPVTPVTPGTPVPVTPAMTAQPRPTPTPPAAGYGGLSRQHGAARRLASVSLVDDDVSQELMAVQSSIVHLASWAGTAAPEIMPDCWRPYRDDGCKPGPALTLASPQLVKRGTSPWLRAEL